MNNLRKLIREALEENKLYPSSIESSITKRLGDNSDELKNLIAIFGLFRQQRPFNQVGDINKVQSKEELQKMYDTWLEQTVKELIKTRDFLDNKNLAIKFVTAYKDNVRKLGGQAKPFSVKNAEKELIDVVNNNNWIKEKVPFAGATSIYSPADSDVIYRDEDIWIVRGDTKAKCVNYGAGKSWCITKPNLNYYTTYRIKHGATIFFCMQPNVKGPEHTFVIMNYGSRGYAIADETNTGDRHGGPELARPWSRIEQEISNLRGKEKYFKYVPVSGEEESYSKLISKRYDGSDLGAYIIDKTNNLVVNGGIITPEDFIRDYVAHGNIISDRQFKSLNDEMREQLIEAGIELTNKMFDEISDTQKRRYVVVRINAKQHITEHQLFSVPEKFQNDYISKLDSGGIVDLLYSSSNPDKIIDIVLSNDAFISRLDSSIIYDLLSKSSNPDKIIDILLSTDGFISKLDSREISSLIQNSSNPDKIIDILLLTDGLISKLNLNLLKYSSNPDKIIDILLSTDGFISKLDSGGIVDLLYSSSNPDKIIDILLSTDGFISKLDLFKLGFLLKYSSNPDKVKDIIVQHRKINESILRKNIRNIIRETWKIR